MQNDENSDLTSNLTQAAQTTSIDPSRAAAREQVVLDAVPTPAYTKAVEAAEGDWFKMRLD